MSEPQVFPLSSRISPDGYACPVNPFEPAHWSRTMQEVDAEKRRQLLHTWRTAQMTLKHRREYRRLCRVHGALEARRMMFGEAR